MGAQDKLIANTNAEREFVGTALTADLLREQGFCYKLDELSEAQRESHPDPFYFYKGEFRLYEVMGEFYMRVSDTPGTGMRIQSLEAMQEAYIAFAGRKYTTAVIPEDTPVPDYEMQVLELACTDADGYTKIKLVGGPGDGKFMLWPNYARHFIYQTVSVVNGKTVKEGFRYEKRKRRKTIYDYVGPTD